MDKRKYVITIGTQGVDTLDDDDILDLLEYAIRKTKSKEFCDGLLKMDAETIDVQEV